MLASGDVFVIGRAMSLISASIRDELVRLYSSPDRHYHNLNHIEAMLELMREHHALLADPVSVEAAIWFHDAIYDTHRNDNEAKSAELARERLAATTSVEEIERIALMIGASANHMVPANDEATDNDCALFLDFDLAVLAAPSAEFAAYEQAVRREYGWVPDPLWIAGRRRVLETFMARPHIFSTALFQSRCEAAARANLTRSLAALSS
jgi:predicted metal-dependent HD superfamily phosphohydrolase